MRTRFFKPFVVVAVASAASLLVACGGGGGDSSSGTSSATISGKAIDFYLSGATVTFLDCKDSAGKPLTITTNATGDFTFPANCAKSALSVTGGTDIGTGLPFNGVMQAPAVDYRPGVTPMISPLTTLVAQLGADQASALAVKLGLSGKDLLTADPMQDAAVLKAAVVVQQLVVQVSKTLQGVATGAGGSLSQDVATAAAAKAVANVVSGSIGPASLSSSATVAAAISASVQNVKSILPAALQGNIDAVANNVAALAAPFVTKQVADVNATLGNIKLGGDASATVLALKTSGALNALKNSSQSTLATALASTASPSALTDSSNASKLANLGNAVATGSAADVQTAASAISGVDSSKLSTVINSVTLTDYLQVGGVTINGTPVTLSGNMSASGTLSDIKAVLTEVGSPFGSGATEMRLGIHYDYNGNANDVIFDKDALVFSGGNQLSATFPANANYSFRVSGNVPASATLTNVSADNVFSSGNGQFTLPYASVLTKVKNSGALTDAQITALTPKAPGTVNVVFAVSGVDGSPVKLGTGTGTAAKAAGQASVETASSKVSGYGLTSTITLN
jgi:hypothetical protein